jgi:hypothetical protein
MRLWRLCRAGMPAVIRTGSDVVLGDFAVAYHRVESGLHPTLLAAVHRRVGTPCPRVIRTGSDVVHDDLAAAYHRDQKWWRKPTMKPFCARPAPTVPPASSATADAPLLSIRPSAVYTKVRFDIA